VINIIIGVALMILGGLIIIGGLQRIATFAERVVPVMAVLYCIGAIAVFFMNISSVGAIFASIFKFAFGIKAVAGGAAGVAISQVITQGCKRGVFSNEAGLGSSVMVHSSSDVKEPVKQGMWGIFEVFFDTFVVCTMTAIVVLSSGYINLETGLPINESVNDATLISQAFGNAFGIVGEWFVAIAMLLFAFTTLLGNLFYCEGCMNYIAGKTLSKKAMLVFNILASAVVFVGALLDFGLVWNLADVLMGIMAIINLPVIVMLGKPALAALNDYTLQRKQGKDPVFRASAIQLEHKTDFWN
jgi:AGCS family alanine or glycine:cation symporter